MSRFLSENEILLNHSDLQTLPQGVHQGDLLFILVLETLAINIRYDTTIEGTKIDNQELTPLIFLDNLTIFLKNKESFSQALPYAKHI